MRTLKRIRDQMLFDMHQTVNGAVVPVTARDLEKLLKVVNGAKAQVDGLLKGDFKAAQKGLQAMIEGLHELDETVE